MEEIRNENPLAKRGPGRPKGSVVKTAEPVVVKTESEVKDSDTVTLTGAELKNLKELLSGKSELSQKDFLKELVEGLAVAVSGRYKTDAEKENDKRQREQMRKSVKQQLKNAETDRLYCRHMAGTNPRSDVPHPHNAFTAIAWHVLNGTFKIGICSICQREFWPTDSDYRYWRSRPSYNKESKTGDRDSDMETWASEEHSKPFGSETGKDPRDVIRERTQPIF